MLVGPPGAERLGNTGAAPAHAVRAMMAEESFAGSAKNFGQMVSAYVRGLYEAAPSDGSVDAAATSEESQEALAPLAPEADVIDELLAGDDGVEAPADDPIADVSPAPAEPLADAENELLDGLTDGETETG